MKSCSAHIAFAASVYALLVLLFTWPLVLNLQTDLIGEGGDSYSHLWGVWWFALGRHLPGASLYDCPIVLWPFGADLTQHDFPIIPNWVGSFFVQSGFTIIGAYNASVLLALWLNAIAMFALARSVLIDDTSDISVSRRDHFLPALAAGIVFAFSTYFWSRCRGHLPYVHGYCLPLMGLALHNAGRRRDDRSHFLVGLALLTAGLCDYYYVTYAVILTLLFHLHQAIDLRVTIETRRRSGRAIVLAPFVFGSACLVVAIVIAAGGGGDWHIGGLDIRARGTANPMIAWWLSWLVSFVAGFRLRVRLRRRVAWSTRLLLPALWTLPAPLLLTPILWRAARLVLSGDFATQALGWKSGPSGIYLISPLLPNLFQFLWGASLRQWFASWDWMEGLCSSIGLTALTLVVWKRSWRGASSWWRFLCLVAFLLALGPFLRLWPGLEHGPILPFWLVRYVPIIGGARIPGRWTAVLLMTWALFVTRALSQVNSRWARVALLGALTFEAWPTLFSRVPPPLPSPYVRIASSPDREALIEIPFGVSDGRTAVGVPYPPERHYLQTFHRHAVVGGYLGRIPDRIFDAYAREPLISDMIKLQSAGGEARLSAGDARATCSRWNVRWVVLDERSTSRALREAVGAWFGPPVEVGDGIALYEAH